MHFTVAFAVCCASVAAAFGQTVTEYDVRNTIPGLLAPTTGSLAFRCYEDTVTTVDSNVAVTFIGDGRPVNFLEVLFVVRSNEGQSNVWDPSALDWKLTGRYGGVPAYQASPLVATGASDWERVYDVPHNLDYTTPVSTTGLFNVYRAEFVFPVILTSPGQQYVVTWSGLGNSVISSRTLALFSNNGNGSFGESDDWVHIAGSPLYPQSLDTTTTPALAARVGYFNTCDSIDFNNDEVFPDQQDLIDFISVYGAGPCSTGNCNDVDFNNDDVFPDVTDITAFVRVFGAGTCD